jgi:hypothetical protein
MNYSLKDQLKVVAPRLSADLVSTEALSHIYTLAQILPPLSNAILECRLGTSASRLDLSVPLPNSAINLPESILIHPVWRRCQNLSQDLADAKSSLHQRVNTIWLEFDVDGEPSNLPIPCIGLHLNQEAACDFQSLREIALNLLEHPLSSHLESNLHLCFEALPAEAKILFIGAALSRQSEAVRLVISGIPPAQFSAYLAHIGWSGSVNELEEVISSISGLVDNIILSFDIADTVFPRIGLECYLTGQAEDEPRWQLFLDHLVTTGLCTPAKRNALLGWLGYEQKALKRAFQFGQKIWNRVQNAATSVGSLVGAHKSEKHPGVNIFSRFTICTKIVYQPGIPLEAKGYLGLWHD